LQAFARVFLVVDYEEAGHHEGGIHAARGGSVKSGLALCGGELSFWLPNGGVKQIEA